MFVSELGSSALWEDGDGKENALRGSLPLKSIKKPGVKSMFWSWGTHSENRDLGKALQAKPEEFGFMGADLSSCHSLLPFQSGNSAVRRAVLLAPPRLIHILLHEHLHGQGSLLAVV